MSPRARLILLAATLVVAAAGEAAAAPSPDVVAGRKVALKACGGCHAVDRGDSPQPGAPQFRYLNKRMDVSDLPNRFQDGIMASHSRMPIVRLDAMEVAQLTAYLKSISPRPKIVL
jgi:mono/diheme cytochrome c family protein